MNDFLRDYVYTASTSALGPPPTYESIVKMAKELPSPPDDVYIFRGSAMRLAEATRVAYGKEENGFSLCLQRGILEYAEIGRWTIIADPATLRSILQWNHHLLGIYLDATDRRSGKSSVDFIMYQVKANELKAGLDRYAEKINELARTILCGKAPTDLTT